MCVFFFPSSSVACCCLLTLSTQGSIQMEVIELELLAGGIEPDIRSIIMEHLSGCGAGGSISFMDFLVR